MLVFDSALCRCGCLLFVCYLPRVCVCCNCCSLRFGVLFGLDDYSWFVLCWFGLYAGVDCFSRWMLVTC